MSSARIVTFIIVSSFLFFPFISHARTHRHHYHRIRHVTTSVKPVTLSTQPKKAVENNYSELSIISRKAPDLDRNVLKLALNAYHRAHQLGVNHKQLLTIIDYRLSSNQPRLWVIDLGRYTVSFHTLVAHGHNSGLDRAVAFSNYNGSHQSTLGVFLTGNTYVGHNGISLVLHGLERGINDKAQARRIVMHGAWYVSNEYARAYGRIGRSFGCPAVSPRLAKPIINTIKNGSILFAYYPNRYWLHNSRFLA